MIRKHKKFNRPRKLYDSTRIEEENKIVTRYGLKNKREIWKAKAKLDIIRNTAKKMIDSGQEDCKILGVQEDNPNYKNIEDIEDVKTNRPEILEQIADFFRVYKGSEEKEVEIIGWEGAESAKKEIEQAQKLFNERK